MELQFIIAAVIILILGSALQSAAGFAFGMFAIPLLMLSGARSFEAMAILSICGTFQTVVGIYALRRHVDWVLVAGLIVLAGACLPIGVWVLHEVDSAIPQESIRQGFGGLILGAVLVQWLWRVAPRETVHWAWGALATGLCGFMSGLSGMGGPPVVLWVMAHRWTNERSRVTLWSLFAGLTPFQFYFLTRQFGDAATEAYWHGVLLSPAVLVGIAPGLWLGKRIGKPALRQMSFVILVLIAVYAIVAPYVW